MRIEVMDEADIELRISLETDPEAMAELGGPRPVTDIEQAHSRSLAMAAEGRCWPLKMIPDGADGPAGTVMIFESTHSGETIYEMGWMVLPAFQGRGIAGEAVRTVLARARAERRFGRLHAFPGVTNGPSNRICEKSGFTLLGEVDFTFSGRDLRCNNWRIDLL